MQVMINISDALVHDILSLQEVEQGKISNYINVESLVNACRYTVADNLLTLVMADINYQIGKKPVLNSYQQR